METNLPLHCDYCDKSFELKTDLERHEKICAKRKGTSGPKKAVCPRCKREVIKLARHLKKCKGKEQSKPPMERSGEVSENLFEGQSFASAPQVDILCLQEQANIERNE